MSVEGTHAAHVDDVDVAGCDVEVDDSTATKFALATLALAGKGDEVERKRSCNALPVDGLRDSKRLAAHGNVDEMVSNDAVDGLLEIAMDVDDKALPNVDERVMRAPEADDDEDDVDADATIIDMRRAALGADSSDAERELSTGSSSS